MARLREIRKWAGTHVIVLTRPDMNDLKLSEGDVVDIEDLVNPNRGKK